MLLLTSTDENTLVNGRLKSTLYIWSESKNKGVSAVQ